MDINSLVLHALVVRLAYDDGHTEEFRPQLSNKEYEIDIPQSRLDELKEILVGDKVQQFVDWLTGSKISDLYDLITNFPKASKTVYGICKIGENIDVADGVISVSGGVGEQVVITEENYTVVHSPTTVIAKNAISVTLPGTPSLGYKVKIKNSTSDKNVSVIGNVDGDSNPTLSARECFSLVFDGTYWNIV